jgi:hypothetical protein
LPQSLFGVPEVSLTSMPSATGSGNDRLCSRPHKNLDFATEAVQTEATR